MNRQASPAAVAALWACVQTNLALLAPPPKLTVSQWADKYAVLPREASAEPGPWRTDRAPYQREMMDVVNDPAIEEVDYMIGSQLGKTAGELNTIWYFTDNDPSPMLLVLPTEKLAEDMSKERIATAIRDTPRLRKLFKDSKTRDSGNTTLNKNFPGGYLAMAGANAPRGLASRSVRVLIMDEIDGYPASAGSEGDPITLGLARTTNFWNRKHLFSSTPTYKDASRIEKLYDRSDKRRYFVPCPQCGEMQVLEWERLKWPRPENGKGEHRPGECYYVCVNGCEILENAKPAMLRGGEWRKTNPTPAPGTAGFQLSSLYSPWLTWAKLIGQYIKAFKDAGLTQPDPELLKAFTNTRLARTYEAKGETVDDKSLLSRRTVYPARVPAGGLVLTCGVDVQANRIEGEVVAWGEDDRSWSVDYFILRGDPTQKALWDELDMQLKRRYMHESGTLMRIASCFIDSGYNTKKVYDFCRPRQVRRIFASKGKEGTGEPLIRPRPQHRQHRSRVDLRLVGIDTAKELLYGNLQVEERDKAGYCAFPCGYLDEAGTRRELSLYDADYFEQLTAEQLITEMQGMTPVRKWVKKREGIRNEVLDCRVYAMAALEDLRVDWKQLAKGMGRKLLAAAVESDETELDGAEQTRQETPHLPAAHSRKRKRVMKRPGFSWIHG